MTEQRSQNVFPLFLFFSHFHVVYTITSVSCEVRSTFTSKVAMPLDNGGQLLYYIILFGHSRFHYNRVFVLKKEKKKKGVSY